MAGDGAAGEISICVRDCGGSGCQGVCVQHAHARSIRFGSRERAFLGHIVDIAEALATERTLAHMRLGIVVDFPEDVKRPKTYILAMRAVGSASLPSISIEGATSPMVFVTNTFSQQPVPTTFHITRGYLWYRHVAAASSETNRDVR